MTEFSITTNLHSPGATITDELKAFAAAGFKAIHWCRHWRGRPVFYDPRYARAAASTLDRLGLRLADVHGYAGTHGTDMLYTDELFRAANVNRAEFARRLGGDVLVIHLPLRRGPSLQQEADHSAAMIESLLPACRKLGVRLAVENLFEPEQSRGFVDLLLERFSGDELGFCYDSGHALLTREADLIRRYGHRLLATHLHDNRLAGDGHRLPGTGSADWPMIMGALRAIDYRRPLNVEVELWPSEAAGVTLQEFCNRAYNAISTLWTDSAQEQPAKERQ